MTEPVQDYRVVAGLRVPLPLVPRLITAIRDRYPEATAGITDPDAAVRAALRAWVAETLTEYEARTAVAPLDTAVARTIADFEERGRAARAQAVADAALIVEDIPDSTA